MTQQNRLGPAWPPLGWPMLQNVQPSHHQAILKDPQSGTVEGLCYMVTSEPLYGLGPSYFRHRIKVDGWTYDIRNESTEYPVFSLSFLDRYDTHLSEPFFITQILSFGQPLPITVRSSRRAFMASLFLTRQIAARQVPEAERVLRMYRLLPSQSENHEEIASPCCITSVDQPSSSTTCFKWKS